MGIRRGWLWRPQVFVRELAGVPDGMEFSKSISTLLRDAASLEAAVVALAREFPEITVGSLLAVEVAEVVELGWEPSPAHRDVIYLATLVTMLRPICAYSHDLPLAQAFQILADSGQHEATEIAAALSALPGYGHALE